MEINIHLELFGPLCEIVGSREIELQVPKGASLEELKLCLLRTLPQERRSDSLKKLLKCSAVASPTDFCGAEWSAEESAHLALIPPVSGG